MEFMGRVNLHGWRSVYLICLPNQFAGYVNWKVLDHDTELGVIELLVCISVDR